MEIPEDVWTSALKYIKTHNNLHKCSKCEGKIEFESIQMDEDWGFYAWFQFKCGFMRYYPGCHECKNRLHAPSKKGQWCTQYHKYQPNCQQYIGRTDNGVSR
jgi:hypothetical protein